MNKGLALLTASILLIASSFAYGQAYVGASVGQTDYEALTNKATSFGAVVGYKLNDYFAIEGGYSDWGNTEDSLLGTVKLSADAFNLSALVMYPVSDKIDIYARGGAYFWDASVSEQVYVGVYLEDDGTDFGYGAGINFDITDSVGVFLEYMMLNGDGEDPTNISAGLKFSFGGNKTDRNRGQGRRLIPGNTYEPSQQSAKSETPAYIDELQALATLRDDGIITEEEFQKQKAKILNSK